jgi:hypothetical protein
MRKVVAFSLALTLPACDRTPPPDKELLSVGGK